MLQLQEVRKAFGAHLILQIPNLDFAHGMYWLKGSNGSGKTTLMKILAGLIPFEGRILLDEFIDINLNQVQYRKAVNYAEAEPLYPSFLTGVDLIKLYQTTKSANPAEVQALVVAFGIDSFIGNSVGTYSSGMIKKLSLVLAFIGQPRVILLDEPLVTLEDHSIPILYDLIQSYHQAKNVTFLITSHQLLRLGDASDVREVTVKDTALCFV